MNTKLIAAASEVIHAAEKNSTVPVTLAIALDAAGLLGSPESAAELSRLRLLTNAQPASLSDEQVEALADAANAAWADANHEGLCGCVDWPAACVGGHGVDDWRSGAPEVGMRALIGLWESMRAPAEADELSRLVQDRAQWRSRYYEESRTYWDAELPPGGECCAVCYQPVESEPCAEHHPATVAARLVEENERLRARVAELEAERHSTNEALSDAAEALRVNRDRIVELEAATEKVAGFCAQRAEYVTNLRNCNPNADHDYYRWSGHAEARRQLSQRLGLPVGWPADDEEPNPRRDASVAKLQALLAGQREDPHDSPLHHTYRLGHDLPEVPRG
ncbi:hypothetical protein [Streptomyces sp. NBC_01565]|uniref:hypothetical protein n=1 Tax=Streptomyces sp. NBC_01565 TaxID=2975881 RepID=UPI002258E1F2|nr:hypothetical protein [Streptomyces sp. NBC_01565]MCX4540457.1 hypothetical protein [Streptomyces sp. NBC_01565]